MRRSVGYDPRLIWDATTWRDIRMRALVLAAIFGLALLAGPVIANDVEIVKVKLTATGGGKWRADVTLLHGDTGWEHYADAWRVVSADGTVLGTRTLYHPHETEQPFTRSLGNIPIAEDAKAVFVEAHDKVHGWSPQRVEVLLGEAKGERFEVKR